MMRRINILSLVALFAIASNFVARAESPRLVINIVVSSMRASDIDRYGDNFIEGGFNHLIDNGTRFTDAHHSYLLNSTPTGLATLSTGALPSVHGIVGDMWWNYVDSSKVTLIEDRKQRPVEFSTGSGNYSAHRLIAPTLGDMLLADDNQSRQYTIAIDALSSIVLNGKAGVALWAERNQTHWTTSSAYLKEMPRWIKDYNAHDTNNFYTLSRWTPIHEPTAYHNDEVAVVEDLTGKQTRLLSDINLRLAKDAYGRMCYTPAGNTMILKFARSLLTLEKLGKDSHTDILNLCFDTSRYIAQTYGSESIEYEDMLYRLDKDLADFFEFVYSHVGSREDVIITLSSDHGTSPSFNPVGSTAKERFNVRQMEVIVNAFLGARYGSDSYILGYRNNALYLNHQLILNKRLSLNDIREEVAVFMLQLRGVASALSATALRNTSFAEGRSRLMQRSFYATRSGDVLIELMPGWMEEDNNLRSTSISGYNYSTHVPMIIAGGNIPHSIIERETDVTVLAPTLARLIGIDSPWASTAKAVREIIE